MYLVGERAATLVGSTLVDLGESATTLVGSTLVNLGESAAAFVGGALIDLVEDKFHGSELHVDGWGDEKSVT